MPHTHTGYVGKGPGSRHGLSSTSPLPLPGQPPRAPIPACSLHRAPCAANSTVSAINTLRAREKLTKTPPQEASIPGRNWRDQQYTWYITKQIECQILSVGEKEHRRGKKGACSVGKGVGAFVPTARQGTRRGDHVSAGQGGWLADTFQDSIPGGRNGSAQSEAGVHCHFWGTAHRPAGLEATEKGGRPRNKMGSRDPGAS